MGSRKPCITRIRSDAGLFSWSGGGASGAPPLLFGPVVHRIVRLTFVARQLTLEAV